MSLSEDREASQATATSIHSHWAQGYDLNLSKRTTLYARAGYIATE